MELKRLELHQRKAQARFEAAGLTVSEVLMVTAAVMCDAMGSYPAAEREKIRRWTVDRIDAGLAQLPKEDPHARPESKPS